jgi:hypothetical protein
MKTKIMIAFIVLVTSAKAQDTTTYVSGPHGGLLKTIENYKIEFISTYDCITTYLFDVDFIAIPNKFIEGSIMFFYNNEVSLYKYLIPSGKYSLNADAPGASYNYCLMDFTINHKSIKIRFDNFSGIAQKEK